MSRPGTGDIKATGGGGGGGGGAFLTQKGERMYQILNSSIILAISHTLYNEGMI